MAAYNFHRLIMGKVKVDLYFYLTVDILTKSSAKMLSGPPSSICYIITFSNDISSEAIKLILAIFHI